MSLHLINRKICPSFQCPTAAIPRCKKDHNPSNSNLCNREQKGILAGFLRSPRKTPLSMVRPLPERPYLLLGAQMISILVLQPLPARNLQKICFRLAPLKRSRNRLKKDHVLFVFFLFFFLHLPLIFPSSLFNNKHMQFILLIIPTSVIIYCLTQSTMRRIAAAHKSQ